MERSYKPGDPGYDIQRQAQSSSYSQYAAVSADTLNAVASFGQVVAELHSVREQERTKRLEIELRYKTRAEKVAKQMEELRSAMKQQFTTDAEYQQESFKLMHSLVDRGSPEFAVEIYRMFVDKERRPIMDYLIEYHDRIFLGKIRIKREQESPTEN